MEGASGLLVQLRGIVADVLEIEPEELFDNSDFVEDHGMDSLRGIEILARVEKHYRIEIPQSELSKMDSLAAVHAVVARYASG